MKLKYTDLIDLATPTLIKKLLSTPVTKDIWLTAVKTARTYGVEFKHLTTEEVQAMNRIAENPNFASRADPITIAKVLHRYVDVILTRWSIQTDDKTAAGMKASLPLFVEMSKYLKHVNPKNEYAMAFRGTKFNSSKVKEFIKNNNNPKDWKSVSIGPASYMAYIGPKKNQFTYKPHRYVQSWSVSDKVGAYFASRHGGKLIATPIDLSFFFDPDFLANYGYKGERETIHFGKEPMKVALMIPKPDYVRYMKSSGVRVDNDINENEEVSDEEGTLTIPL